MVNRTGRPGSRGWRAARIGAVGSERRWMALEPSASTNGGGMATERLSMGKTREILRQKPYHARDPAAGGGRRRRMTTTLVNASKQEGVMVLELRNPPANTYSYEMMRELDAQILDARVDPNVHVIVLTGARPLESAPVPSARFLSRRPLSPAPRWRRRAG